jgi:flagellar hook-basal body complex protein FliE
MAAPIQGLTPNPISQIGTPALPSLPRVPKDLATAKTSPDFSQTFTDALAGAHSAENAASDASAKFAAGDPSVGMHEVIIAAEKANIQVRFAVTLKNRILEAYKEIMNTPV